MAHFEETYRELNIPLLVLPPRKPAYNGGVERGNRTFKEEFYRNPKLIADSVGAIRAELSHALYKTNIMLIDLILRCKTKHLSIIFSLSSQEPFPSVSFGMNLHTRNKYLDEAFLYKV